MRSILRRGHLTQARDFSSFSSVSEVISAIRQGSLAPAAAEAQLRGLLLAEGSPPLPPGGAAEVTKSASVEEMTELVGGFARIDHGRALRTGLPEVIYASGKSAAQVLAIFHAMQRHQAMAQAHTHKGSQEEEQQHGGGGGGGGGSSEAVRMRRSVVAMATRLTPETYHALRPELPTLRYYEDARIAALHSHADDHGGDGGGGGGGDGGAAEAGREALPSASSSSSSSYDVAVLCAGTSDVCVAEECAVTCGLMGLEVERVYDVGVAGLHRLLAQAPLIRRARVVVVVAGMDGALPSVVGGIARSPVVAVPTSVGYGAAFGGVAALLTMLNACAPGVSVVNIDNGFGAAMAAIKMLDIKPKTP